VQPAGGHKPYKGRLRVDSGFYLELQFCYEQGIPHSKLLQWDPVDRAKLLAFVTERGTRCVMCGTADTGRNMDGITIELARNDNSVETLKRHALQRKLAKSS
jgi:hypothetical protein